MHIAEGYLPLHHAAAWTGAFAPHLWAGLRHPHRRRLPLPPQVAAPLVRATGDRPALVAAIAFGLLLTSLKLPSVAGSSAHPTGMALGTALLGPTRMAPVALGILLLQALLLAHGGLTTLGANAWALGVVGPWVTWATWRALQRLGRPEAVALGAAAALGDLATYLATAVQLTLAQSGTGVPLASVFLTTSALFGVTQLPIALLEGILTTVAWRALAPERHHPTLIRP
jgi:cobalt/nickel transport system permease protein